jgi:DNA helicase-2/ATP-dependent DNA helicase PcrA
MFKKGMGYRIGTTKLLIKNRAVPKQKLTFTYKKRLSQEKADFLWFLGAYKDNEEALFYEQFYSIKYGLPTWIFYSDTRESKHSEYFIKKLFKELDTKKNALALLKDLLMFPEYPHHIPCCMNSDRQKNFNITLGITSNCTNRYKKTYTYNLHHYSILGIDTKIKEKLNDAGFKTLIRKSKRKNDYRIENASMNLRHIYEVIKKIRAIIPINVTVKGSFSTISLPIIPASHVLPGMSCFIENNGKIEEDIIESVEKKSYSGKIYDLKINYFHNIIMNNIVTYSPLNTIYE